jgi:hypothetical protein
MAIANPLLDLYPSTHYTAYFADMGTIMMTIIYLVILYFGIQSLMDDLAE